MKDFRNLKQKLVGVGKAPPIRAAETPAKPSVVRPIEERETIEIERCGLAEIYIYRAAPYTDRATLPSSQSTAGRPAAIERTAPNDSNGESPPGLSAAPGGALAHTEASQISAESAQQAGPWPEAPPANPAQQAESAQQAPNRTPKQKAIVEFANERWPDGNIPITARVREAMAGSEVWRCIAAKHGVSRNPPDWKTINTALGRGV